MFLVPLLYGVYTMQWMCSTGSCHACYAILQAAQVQQELDALRASDKQAAFKDKLSVRIHEGEQMQPCTSIVCTSSAELQAYRCGMDVQKLGWHKVHLGTALCVCACYQHACGQAYLPIAQMHAHAQASRCPAKAMLLHVQNLQLNPLVLPYTHTH